MSNVLGLGDRVRTKFSPIDREPHEGKVVGFPTIDGEQLVAVLPDRWLASINVPFQWVEFDESA